MKWIHHLQLAVCYDRIGDTFQANEHNEAAAVYAPVDNSSIEHNKIYFRSKLVQENEQSKNKTGIDGKQNLMLSILIPSLPERSGTLAVLQEELKRQTVGRPVEVLVLTDNKKRTVGDKRNALIALAKGEYVVFVDDDDRVADHYVESLLSTIETSDEPDCVVFDTMVYSGGKPFRLCKYGVEYEHGISEQCYYRKPIHLMCYKRDLALRHSFENISYGEDDEWASRASRDINKQVRINKVLYHYDWVIKPSDWYFSN